jgi:hypothetical protein
METVMNEKREELELVELGDAKEETKGTIFNTYDDPLDPNSGRKV